MRTLKKTEQGFTIIELIVVIAVFIVILLGLLALYDNYNKIYNVQEANSRVIGASTLTGLEIQNAVKQAIVVLSSYSFSGTTHTTDSDTLVLQLPAIDSNGDIISSQYDYYAFYLDTQKLYMRVLPYSGSQRKAVTKQLSDTVSSVSFSYNNGDLSLVTEIDVNILMAVTVRQTSVSQRLEQTLFLHN